MRSAELRTLRRRIVDLAARSGEGHIPSSLSVLDILYVLYDEILTIDDFFVLSKGHASLALYACLEHFRHYPCVYTFCEYDSKYGGHPSTVHLPLEVPFSTGSLGHGLPQAVGLALARSIDKKRGRIYVLMGDQEANEGTLWESLLLIKKFNLTQLTIIIDDNRSAEGSLPLPNLQKLFESFGWFIFEARDGHDHQLLRSAFLTTSTDQPTIIIARTTKGYGIPAMVADPKAWHHRVPNGKDEYNRIIESIQ